VAGDLGCDGGLIDLARLPRGVARTDTHYPKLWGAWSALVMTLLMVMLLGARRIVPARVHEIDLVFVSLAAAPVCVFAMVVGLIVRSVTRRGGVASTP
jgi:hypothetical protein